MKKLTRKEIMEAIDSIPRLSKIYGGVTSFGMFTNDDKEELYINLVGQQSSALWDGNYDEKLDLSDIYAECKDLKYSKAQTADEIIKVIEKEIR